MARFNKTVFTKRHTNLSWAICSTLMCICFPLGLIAVLVALKSKRAWQQDRPETAGDMADMAKTIALLAILSSIIVICIFIALIVSGYFYRFLWKIKVINEDTLQRLLNEQGEMPVDTATQLNNDHVDVDYENIPDGEPKKVEDDEVEVTIAPKSRPTTPKAAATTLKAR